MRAVADMGWPSGGMPMLTTAETARDLLRLREALTRINSGVPRRHKVVLTPFWVVGGPDYAAMRASGCPGSRDCRYHELFWHNSSGGLARAPYLRGDLRPHYLELFHLGLWHPEYHGRSHFDATAWVDYLRRGDEFARYYFGRGMTMYYWGFRDEETNSTHSLHCEYLADDTAHTKSVAWTRSWLAAGLDSFQRFWGYASKVTSVPTHHAPPYLGEILAASGVLAVEHNQLDFVDSIPRFEIDLDSYLQLGGAAAVQSEAHRQRETLQRRLADEDFLALQWHSQNALASMYSSQEAELLLDEFGRTVDMIRQQFPGVVFVTASELAQLKAAGVTLHVPLHVSLYVLCVCPHMYTHTHTHRGVAGVMGELLLSAQLPRLPAPLRRPPTPPPPSGPRWQCAWRGLGSWRGGGGGRVVRWRGGNGGGRGRVGGQQQKQHL